MPKKHTEPKVLDQSDFKSHFKIQTLTLNYHAIACSCAQWSESEKKENSDKKTYYWLEPANENLIDADRLFDGNNLPLKIRITGQVVTEKGFPENKNLAKVDASEAGKVFRYTTIEVLQR